MKVIMKNRSNLTAVVCNYFFSAALILMLTTMVPAPVAAGELVTYEGIFQGASCVHYKKECPNDDAHIAIEHDFVLLLPNGKHYFLPNLNRAIKARYVAKPFRINGELKGHEIWVDRLDKKYGGKFTNVWSWEKQKEMYMGGGGE